MRKTLYIIKGLVVLISIVLNAVSWIKPNLSFLRILGILGIGIAVIPDGVKYFKK